MAQQMKFCRSCGKQIDQNAKFCRYCGFQFDNNPKQAPKYTAAQPVQQAQQPPSGSRIASAAITGAAGAVMTAAKGAPSQMLSQIPGAAARTQEVPASAHKGEESFELGDLGMGMIDQATGGALGTATGVVNGMKNRANEILSPIKTLISGFQSFFRNLAGFFKNPKAAIPVILLGILWIILGLLRDSDSPIIKALSWFTFSEGGLDREALGTFGGICGKGVVAVAITSIFNGGLRDIASGVGSLFGGRGRKKEDKISFPLLIVGIAIGILAYIFFVGLQNMSGLTTMAGIAGILVTLRSLGSKDGFLYEFARSLTAKVQNGVRTAQNGKIAGLFTGMTGGFALITAITALL